MITDQLNKLFEKQNLNISLCYTLIGLSLLKERFKDYDNNIGSEGHKKYQGLLDAEYLTYQYLSEINK